MTTIKFIIFGIALFFTLKIVSRLLNVFSNKYLSLKRFNYFFPAIELSCWLAFVFWAIHVLFREQFFYPILMISIMLVVIISISWFLVKDFISGIIFKTQNEFRRGQKIKFSSISGRILDMGPTYLKLETRKGETMKIPYSKLSNETLVKKGDMASTDNFKMKLKLALNRDKDQLATDLKTSLMSLPWTSANKEPTISSTNESSGFLTFEIMYYCLNENHAYYIEKAMKEKFAPIQ